MNEDTKVFNSALHFKSFYFKMSGRFLGESCRESLVPTSTSHSTQVSGCRRGGGGGGWTEAVVFPGDWCDEECMSSENIVAVICCYLP